MMGRSAVIVGVTTWSWVAHAADYDATTWAAGVSAAALTSLLPDVDSPGSHAAQAFGPLRKPVTKIVGIVFGGHREGTHSLLVAGIATAAASLAAPWLALAVLSGYLVGGIFTDVITRQGVALAWPLSKRKISILPLRTGAWYEYPITLSYAGFTIGYLT